MYTNDKAKFSITSSFTFTGSINAQGYLVLGGTAASKTAFPMNATITNIETILHTEALTLTRLRVTLHANPYATGNAFAEVYDDYASIETLNCGTGAGHFNSGAITDSIAALSKLALKINGGASGSETFSGVVVCEFEIP